MVFTGVSYRRVATRLQVCDASSDKDTCSWCHNKQSDPDVIPDALDASWVGPDDLNPHGSPATGTTHATCFDFQTLLRFRSWYGRNWLHAENLRF